MLSFNKLPKSVTAGLKIVGLLLSLYFFIVGVCGMGDAFTMFGGDFAEKVMGATKNPLAALMMGFLATSIVQSSAATITIVVGMVAGNVLTISAAVPMIMGANIGTTITAMLVSFACVRKKDEFERAYGAALLHLAFNVITTLILFPLEYATGLLSKLAGYGTALFQHFGGMVLCNPLKLATQPAIDVIEKLCFHNAIAFLIVMTVLMYATLAGLVAILQGMVMVKVEKFFDKVLFSSWQRSMLFGIFLTATIQTSSVTTSLAITLVGAGAMKLAQSYAFTLGANIGTTITTFIAALATASPLSITVAFSHVLFNIIGVLIIWPFPAIRKLPLDLVTATARWCVSIRFMPIIFIAVVYFILPAAILFIIH
jgi:solute carrier family 34 (sodium-dependent phosphate cotransporter)